MLFRALMQHSTASEGHVMVKRIAIKLLLDIKMRLCLRSSIFAIACGLQGYTKTKFESNPTLMSREDIVNVLAWATLKSKVSLRR